MISMCRKSTAIFRMKPLSWTKPKTNYIVCGKKIRNVYKFLVSWDKRIFSHKDIKYLFAIV